MHTTFHNATEVGLVFSPVSLCSIFVGNITIREAYRFDGDLFRIRKWFVGNDIPRNVVLELLRNRLKPRRWYPIGNKARFAERARLLGQRILGVGKKKPRISTESESFLNAGSSGSEVSGGRFLVVCLTPRLCRVPPGALLLAENATEDGVPGCGAGLVCCLEWWLGQLGRGVSCRIVK
jgi:hypothetical protein